MQELIIYGIRLSYHVSEPEGADDDTPTLLFIHGWCSSSLTYYRQAAQFGRSYRCIFVDLPGHGKSAKPLLDYSIVLFAEIMLGFVGKLKLKKPVLLGHSMGGCIALEMIHQQPDVARALVLLDPAIIVPDARVVRVFERALGDLKENGVAQQFPVMAKRMFFNREDPAHLVDWAINARTRVPDPVALSAWAAMLDWHGKPALRAAAGVASVYIASDKPSNSYSDITALHSDLRWAQPVSASHSLHITTPGQVNAMIQAFLTRQEIGTARRVIPRPPGRWADVPEGE